MGDFLNEMQVQKRNGNYEEVSFDKILNRVKNLGTNIKPPLSINYGPLVIKVIDQLYDGINTTSIDELTAEQCAALCTKHPDYGILASRIIVSNNHKNTLEKFFYEDNNLILTDKVGYPQFYTQLVFEKNNPIINIKTVINNEESLSKISTCNKVTIYEKES